MGKQREAILRFYATMTGRDWSDIQDEYLGRNLGAEGTNRLYMAIETALAFMNEEENMSAQLNQVDNLCPKCGEPMENLGNVSGIVMTSMPPQWDEVLVCRKDRTKRTRRVHGTMPEQPNLDGYKDATDELL